MPPETKKPFKPDLTFADKLVGAGLELYGRNVNRENLPLHKRIFLESVVDARKDPITESSMKEPERQALMSVIRGKYKSIEPSLTQYEQYLAKSLEKHRNAVAKKDKDKMMYPEFADLYKKDLNAIRQYKKGVITQEFIDLTSGGLIPYPRLVGLTDSKVGLTFRIKPVIGYEDYPIQKKDERNVFTNLMPEALEQTFGRIAYGVDPQTKQLVLKEDYDFNPLPPGQTQTTTTEGQLAMTPEFGGGPLYNAVRLYAGKVLPPGQGRPLNVRLNQLAPVSQNALIR